MQFSLRILILLAFLVQFITHASHALDSHFIRHRGTSNYTFLGVNPSKMSGGCKHNTDYFINPRIQFKFCLAHNDEFLENGRSISDMIVARGYMPTCRILHLLLWMYTVVTDPENQMLPRDHFFLDVGANIGACTNHIAALGVSVISVEPVPGHVHIIKETMAYNPNFHIQLFHGGVLNVDKLIKANFMHQNHNWGNSFIVDSSTAATVNKEGFQEEDNIDINLISIDSLMKHKKIALLKLDCEGCEWLGLLGAEESLKHLPMIKMELVNPTCKHNHSLSHYALTAKTGILLTIDPAENNTTVTPKEILKFLAAHDYEIFYDAWNEAKLYNGRYKKHIVDVDRLFGSNRFGLEIEMPILDDAARLILKETVPIEDFDLEKFLQRSMDIIAIKKSLVQMMKAHWLP